MVGREGGGRVRYDGGGGGCGGRGDLGREARAGRACGRRRGTSKRGRVRAGSGQYTRSLSSPVFAGESEQTRSEDGGRGAAAGFLLPARATDRPIDRSNHPRRIGCRPAVGVFKRSHRPHRSRRLRSPPPYLLLRRGDLAGGRVDAASLAAACLAGARGVGVRCEDGLKKYNVLQWWRR